MTQRGVLDGYEVQVDVEVAKGHRYISKAPDAHIFGSIEKLNGLLGSLWDYL